MKQEYKEKFPQWVNDSKKYYMCLTDDIDSLLSCLLLQQIKGYEISHFYDFEDLYKADNYVKGAYKLVGVDMDMVEHKCWGNHTTGIYNPKSANINVIERINVNNFFSKYAGSTLLQIISYYDYDISNLSEEAKMVLLCVDGMFIPFFPQQIDFSGTQKRYLKILELEELIDVAKRHTEQEFYNLTDKYKLNKKIFLNEEGKLKTAIDLEGLSKLFNLSFLLKENLFLHSVSYKEKGVKASDYKQFKDSLEKHGYKIFTQAITNKNWIMLSYKKIKK